MLTTKIFKPLSHFIKGCMPKHVINNNNIILKSSSNYYSTPTYNNNIIIDKQFNQDIQPSKVLLEHSYKLSYDAKKEQFSPFLNYAPLEYDYKSSYADYGTIKDEQCNPVAKQFAGKTLAERMAKLRADHYKSSGFQVEESGSPIITELHESFNTKNLDDDYSTGIQNLGMHTEVEIAN